MTPIQSKGSSVLDIGAGTVHHQWQSHPFNKQLYCRWQDYRLRGTGTVNVDIATNPGKTTITATPSSRRRHAAAAEHQQYHNRWCECDHQLCDNPRIRLPH
ncbi:MAG: hypothetical protein WDM76_03710 [Limisphaerales bacterium]